jgi:enoyl-CoA hydratase/carnithine racemase
MEWGLVSKTVPAESLGGALAQIVAALLAKPTTALRLTQKLLRHDLSAEILERFELENAHFSERLRSAEVREAITAFYEKRKPDFSDLG